MDDSLEVHGLFGVGQLGEQVLEVLFLSLCLDDFLGGSRELVYLAFWLFVGVGEE